jgi:urease accessory protein UreE
MTHAIEAQLTDRHTIPAQAIHEIIEAAYRLGQKHDHQDIVHIEAEGTCHRGATRMRWTVTLEALE